MHIKATHWKRRIAHNSRVYMDMFAVVQNNNLLINQNLPIVSFDSESSK